ncbi:Uncharacterised protein [Yersinia enterocolitica]|uniref:hypothetical protein n=1 Tax=Yersinia enterocolitica TaxID=630 RepID=UPI0005E2ECC4|nr:hypothetical protein [Yersinia enterocolitica]CNH57606.1 Uncharacterised protein [Yersinia enterocolitica]HDX5739921.1 hypothetical protein [Yersinia enterocolitica]
MTNKEEFLAYLKEASEQVNTWPTWKKSGLSDTSTGQAVTSPPVHEHKAAKSVKQQLA